MKNLTTKRNSKPINRNTQTQNFYRPGFEMQVKKQLSATGKVFVVVAYTFAIVISTLKFNDKKKPRISYEDREIIKRELLKEIESKTSIALVAPMKNSFNQHRAIASTSKLNPIIKDKKIIVYSKVNEKVLKFKLRQKYKRVEEAYNQKRELLLTTLDLRSANDKIKLQDFDDNMKLELYTLRANNYETREKFEKNKYMAQN
jgi:hypothetical protein